MEAKGLQMLSSNLWL